MTFKSKLGRIALEELNESQDDANKEAEAAAAAAASTTGDAAAAAGADAGATGAVDAGATGGESGAAAGADAGAAGDAAAADAATAAAGDAAAGAGDAAGADAGAGASGDAAAAAAAGDTGAAAGADAGATGDAAGATGADAGATGADAGAADAATGAAVVDPAAAADGDAAAAAAAAAGGAEATGDPADAVAEVAGEADPESEVVEEEMTAVDQLEDQSDDVNEDVEKLTEATESLEGCVAILDAAAQRGGLDIFGASLLRNNVTTVTKSLRVKPMMLPALEDMESPSAKIDGAQTAKQQIVAFIKRILDAIKSAFVRLGEWIVETYKRLTNAFVAVERRAENLSARAKASKMKEGKIENKALATKMTVAGEPAQDVVAHVKRMGELAKYLNDPKSYKVYLEAVDLCEELVKNPEKDEEVRGKISAKLAQWAGDMEKHGENITKAARLQAAFASFTASGAANKRAADQLNLFAAPLMNNEGLVVALPATAETVRGMSAVIEPCTQEAKTTSVDALDQAQAVALCNAVFYIAKEVRESGDANKGGVKELVAEIAKRKDTITALTQANASKELEEMGAGEKMRKVVLFINGLLMTAPKLPVHAINRALPRNLSYALDYVAASIAGPAEKAAA